MKKYRRVVGERIVAALVDGVIMYIVGLIISVVGILFFGFENFFNMMFSPTVDGETIGLSNEMLMYTMMTTYAGLVVSIIYFVVIPWKWNGQTLGKKMLRLRAINEYGENPNFFQHFIRAVQNWNTYLAGLVTWTIFISIWFSWLLTLLSLLVWVLIIIAFIMMLAREDGKGLHDIFANTNVISVDENLDKDFAETTAQMGDWVEVDDKEDEWNKKEEDKNVEDDDEWNF